MPEVSLGTLSGAFSFNRIFNRTNNISSSGNSWSLLSLILADTVANGQDSQMLAYIKSKFGLTVP